MVRRDPMAPEPADKIRVLVVDDHEVVRRGLFAFLDSESDLEVVGDAKGMRTGAPRPSHCSPGWTPKAGDPTSC
jgi:hypothetical protein